MGHTMAVKAKVVAHSKGATHGKEVVSWSLRYWRSMHAELMTHRDFSRNASSSRAIPVKKMIRQTWKEPAGPIHWGKNQSGMQANEQLTGWRLWLAKKLWRSAAKFATAHSWAMMKIGLHKQVANRVTEPYQYITVLVTATEVENFYALRRHIAAQPEMREIADAMYACWQQSTPQILQPGEWHIPYVTPREVNTYGLLTALKLSTARNARVSYLNHDSTKPTVEEDTRLHDRLVGESPIHASPAEHPVQCVATPERHANLVGFRSYRRAIETKTILINGVLQPLDLGKKPDSYFS